jgi:hypothetical protein
MLVPYQVAEMSLRHFKKSTSIFYESGLLIKTRFFGVTEFSSNSLFRHWKLYEDQVWS